MERGPISKFITHHYRHFNSATLVDAAKAYDDLMNRGGKMMLAMAGAMSTAELGISLAEMIRQGKFSIVSCSANNLEEDIMNLVAHSHYKRVPNYRDLTPEQEHELLENHMNRVTDTCIPEEEAFRRLEHHLVEVWNDMKAKGERLFPWEVIYRLLRSGVLEQYYEIDPKDSWVLAACEKNIPIVVPAWEDCTTANIFTAHCIRGEFDTNMIKNGIETMIYLTEWYRANGDFPICVVPMMAQDLEWKDVPLWSYFCQISDSTTSYGSYSGAVPNEKITWGKLSKDTPRFIVESDATIVAPLIFAYVLGW